MATDRAARMRADGALELNMQAESRDLPLTVVVSARPEHPTGWARQIREYTGGSFPIRIEVVNTSDAKLEWRIRRGDALPVKVDGAQVEVNDTYQVELNPFEQCSMVVEVRQKPN